MLKHNVKLIALCLVALFALSACSTPTPSSSASTPVSGSSSTSEAASTPSESVLPSEATAINIAAMRGPTSMGLVKLMKDADNGETVNDYTFTLAGAADEITANIVNGSLDIAAVPVNLASVLYNRTEGGVMVLALNTLGVLYVIEAGDTIESVEDLRGQTIFSTGKNTTPEFSLNYILDQNGISLEEVTIDYRSEASEVGTLLEQGQASIAVLPEPYVTTVLARNDSLRIALSLSDEWDKVSGDNGALVTGAVIVRTEFLEENKEAVDAFMDEYKASVAYAQEDIEGTAALIAEYGIIPSAALAAVALPKCNVVFREGAEMKKDISSYLDILFTANPQSVGGAVPHDEFYYAR